jgi:DNA-binding response OmpR family regulator
MDVLIVAEDRGLATLWQRHLERQGHDVQTAQSQLAAVDKLAVRRFSVIILDLALSRGSPLAVSDFASYRWPDARIIFVTNRTFFSDGSIFGLSANACACVQSHTPPDDLAAMIEHYGKTA